MKTETKQRPTRLQLTDEAVRSIASILVVDCIQHNFWPQDAQDCREWASETFDMNQMGALGNELWHEELMQILTDEMNEKYYQVINDIHDRAFDKAALSIKSLEHDSYENNKQCFKG